MNKLHICIAYLKLKFRRGNTRPVMEIDNHHNSLSEEERIDKLIEMNRNILLPYDIDEMRGCKSSDIRYMGQLSEEKRENFKKNRDYKDVEHGLFKLFTDYKTNRYKVFPGDHIRFTFGIENKTEMNLGRGVFGEVIKCQDKRSYMDRAIKIIKNETRYTKAAENEISILLKLKNGDLSPYVVYMHEYFKYRGHIFIVFDYLYKNMYEIIQSNRYKGFPIDQCIDYGTQLAEGIKFIHNLDIIHCDLKPENIMFKTRSLNEIVIIDFGLSYTTHKMMADLSNAKINSYAYNSKFYVQSRYYRSVETTLCLSKDKNIDIWSYGAILYEMLFGKPLFPAKSGKLLETIIDVIGYPPLEFANEFDLVCRFSCYDLFEDRRDTNHFLDNKKSEKKVKYINKYTINNYLNLIRSCIEWDFRKRLKAPDIINFMLLIESCDEHNYAFNIEANDILIVSAIV